MLFSIDGAPYSYRCVPKLRYGIAPDGTELLLDLLLPDLPGPRPGVLYLHGGGWENGARSDALYPWINPPLAANGFITASATYRLTGTAPFPAQIHDAKAAVRWLRANANRYGLDPDRIGVWGDSAGGHLAALLGTSAAVAELEGDSGTPGVSSAVQAVVPRCAPTNLVGDLPLGLEPDIPRVLDKLFAVDRDHWAPLASAVTHAGPDAPPHLLVHGTADGVVPFSQAEQLVAALRAHDRDVTLHSIDGGLHSLLTPEEEASGIGLERGIALAYEALEFFTKHLAS